MENTPRRTTQSTSRALGALALSLSLAGLLLCFISVNRMFGLGIQYGALGTWVGGLASAAAAGAAYMTLRQLLRARNVQEEDRRSRALRRAGRVEVRIEPTQTVVAPYYPLGWAVSVANRSDDSIYDVRVGRVLTALVAGAPANTVTLSIPMAADTHPPAYLGAGEVQEFQFISNKEIVNSTYGFVPIEFTDEDGNRFRSVPAALSPSGRIVSRWVHSDALTANGEWRRPTDRIEPSPTLVSVAGQVPQSVYQHEG